VAFFAAFRHISPARATMIGNIEPLLGVLVAVAVLGERLAGWQWLGVGVVVAGLVLFEKSSVKE
jgi:drug/metabolite transporter (DMT)-like permease